MLSESQDPVQLWEPDVTEVLEQFARVAADRYFDRVCLAIHLDGDVDDVAIGTSRIYGRRTILITYRDLSAIDRVRRSKLLNCVAILQGFDGDGVLQALEVESFPVERNLHNDWFYVKS
ncbi:hypothetical protein ALI22I_20625 [Saccharothrix sp. ALI-22-I]|nr:hypothetical protein ALI22I_20625 [Saccharothrix sp. ALI-22-I]